jgi:hypothetical protein
LRCLSSVCQFVDDGREDLAFVGLSVAGPALSAKRVEHRLAGLG